MSIKSSRARQSTCTTSIGESLRRGPRISQRLELAIKAGCQPRATHSANVLTQRPPRETFELAASKWTEWGIARQRFPGQGTSCGDRGR